MSKEDDYQVGYKKPPKHTRFKKGQSGNPKGRPKKVVHAPSMTTLRESVLRAAMREVTITENGVSRKVPAIEAVYNQLAAKAATGNMQAIKLMISLTHEKTEEHDEAQLRFMELLLAKEDALEEAFQRELAEKGPD